MPTFCGGSSADQAHHALKNCVKVMDQAQHCAVLWFGDIMSRRLFRELGYSTMRAYAMQELGFSSTRAGDFMRLASKLETLPVVKAKVASGKLGYTQAREIIKVADRANESEWVAVAERSSREELAMAVKKSQAEQRANPNQGVLMPRTGLVLSAAEKPIHVGFDLTPTQYARYEAMLKKVDHRGSSAELLLDLLGAKLEAKSAANFATESASKLVTDSNTKNIAPRGATRSPHYQVHIHRCPDCDTHAVAASQGEKKLSDAEVAAVQCDALVAAPDQRNTSITPPKRRRQVMARDRHRCRRKGCHNTRYLDIHHLVPRAHGGSNDMENLVTLCTGCHHLWHEQGGDMRPLLRTIKPSSKIEFSKR